MNNDRKPEKDSQFKTSDASSYNKVVNSFDKFTERFTSYLSGSMLELADVRSNYRILDVGTGTGVVALKIAGNLSDNGSIVGIDLSDGMLARASEKAENLGLSDRAKFLKMDAEALDFENNSFDAVLSLYALRHFPNPEKAVCEIYRVLKEGGRVVVGVGSRPALFSLQGIVAAFRRISSIIRRNTGRELVACEYLDKLVDEYIPESESGEIAEWTGHKHQFTGSVRDLLNAAGFKNIRTTWKGQYSIIESPEDFWLLQMTFSSLARKRIGQADESMIEKLKTRFFTDCEKVLARHGRLVYQSGAAIVSGVKIS